MRVFNLKMLELYVPVQEASIYQWLQEQHQKILKGK